jgi:hypothetical protein
LTGEQAAFLQNAQAQIALQPGPEHYSGRSVRAHVALLLGPAVAALASAVQEWFQRVPVKSSRNLLLLQLCVHLPWKEVDELALFWQAQLAPEPHYSGRSARAQTALQLVPEAAWSSFGEQRLSQLAMLLHRCCLAPLLQPQGCSGLLATLLHRRWPAPLLQPCCCSGLFVPLLHRRWPAQLLQPRCCSGLLALEPRAAPHSLCQGERRWAQVALPQPQLLYSLAPLSSSPRHAHQIPQTYRISCHLNDHRKDLDPYRQCGR